MSVDETSRTVNSTESSSESIGIDEPTRMVDSLRTKAVDVPVLSGRVRSAEQSFGEAQYAMQSVPPKKKKTVSAAKKKALAAKKNAAKLPGPILPLDIRRTYAKLLLNAFNSCDIKRLEEVLDKYCVPDILAHHRYEGIKNPYGRNFTKLKGREVILGLWKTLFKSAPDFLFVPLETRAFYDLEYRVVVACQFTWSGTRVMDIKYAGLSNESVLRDKLAHPNRYPTDEQLILNESIAEKEAHQNATMSATADTASQTAAATTVDTESTEKSFFHGQGELVLESSEDSETPLFSLSEAPMAQKLKMSCKGTFIVYLNEENMIHKFEFVYIAVHEAEALGRVGVAAFPPVADGTTPLTSADPMRK